MKPRPKEQRIPIGGISISEKELQRKLLRLQRAIKNWALQRDLWFEESFRTPFRQRDQRPRPCEALYLISEGSLAGVGLGGIDDGETDFQGDFIKLLEQHGFTFEMVNHYTFALYPIDEKLQEDYLVLDRWRWVQGLAKKRLYDVHMEVFAHFAQRPDDLQRLTWRQYEEFLDAVFRNQGFITELGPGSGDGGVDIRLYQSGAIPELVTLVQARRYRQRPVGLEAVAALSGLAAAERAPKGMLATTSRFLPVAQNFAATTRQRVDLPSIELATSATISGWCWEVARHLNQFFSQGRGPAPVPIARQQATELTGKIVVANRGYNCSMNFFAIIEADFRHEVVLRVIGSRRENPSAQAGTEIPCEQETKVWHGDSRFVAFKREARSNQDVRFWGEDMLFHLWDGKPVPYDWCD